MPTERSPYELTVRGFPHPNAPSQLHASFLLSATPDEADRCKRRIQALLAEAHGEAGRPPLLGTVSPDYPGPTFMVRIEGTENGDVKLSTAHLLALRGFRMSMFLRLLAEAADEFLAPFDLFGPDDGE